jgi:hypothetical protein
VKEKLAMLDVDGTVIDPNYRTTVSSDELVRVLTKAQENGVVIGLNSDSAFPTIVSWARQWNIKGPLLAEKSVVCLPDEGMRTIPVYKGLERFTEIRDAFVLRLMQSDLVGKVLTVVGDVNNVVDRMPAYGPEDHGAQALIAVNGLRQFSLSFFVRAWKENGWAARKDMVANGPVLAQAIELLEKVGAAYDLQHESKVWSQRECVPDPRYGICIARRSKVDKQTPVARLLSMRSYAQVYMIGDDRADLLKDDRVIQCAVGNANQDCKDGSALIASGTYTEGVIELIERIANGP